MAGLAKGALDHAIAYAKERQQFGKPIAEFQGVQFELAQMATEVDWCFNPRPARGPGATRCERGTRCDWFQSAPGPRAGRYGIAPHRCRSLDVSIRARPEGRALRALPSLRTSCA